MHFRRFLRTLLCGISIALSLYFILLYNQKAETFEDAQQNFYDVELKITAGPNRVFIAANNSVIVNGTNQNERGIHVAILNEFYGYAMAYRKFDTFEVLICDELLEFLAAVSPGRIIILATKDEASYCRNSKI